MTFGLPEKLYKVRADYLGYQFWSDDFTWADTTVTTENGIARIHVHRSGSPVVGARVYLFKGSEGYLGQYSDTDDGGIAEFQLPDRQYKFRADWEGSQYWIDPITIIPHEVNEIDMDLDLLGFNLTGNHLYAHNNPEKIQLAMVGLPYGLFVSSVIAAPSVTETIYYYHNDHLGTPQVLTDDQGQIVWRADYKPFGEVDILVENVKNNFRFPGQYFDGETGLHYNYHRYYHSGIGKYLRVDPIGLEGGINGYLYANNSPVNFIDSYGLKVEKCCGMTSRMPKQSVMTGLECMSKCLKTTISISGGWRTKKQNDDAGGHPNSYHLKGLAADVHIPPSRSKLRKAAKECRFYVLAKKYPRHIHVDLRGGRKPKDTPNEHICKKIRGGK